MIRSLLAAAVGASLLSGVAAAQEKATAKAGEEVRVGWIGSVGANCTAEPAPEVTPVRVADHGQVKLMKGTVKTNGVEGCPGIEVPAVVVFYTSAPGYKGADTFTLSTGEGSPERRYEITVE